MACAYPYRFKNPWFDNRLPSVYVWNREYYDVACGRCLNCLVDRRNWLEDLCNWHFVHRCNCQATFLTLTYDNNHISDLFIENPDAFSPDEYFKTDSNGQLVYSLRYEHLSKFIKSLRRYIDYHYPDKALKLLTTVRKDFSWLAVGEYGTENIPRPHFHILIFGLNYKAFSKVYKKIWHNGFTMSLPLYRGGIRYVLKYLDKQMDKKQLADEGYEIPHCVHSNNLAQDFIAANIDYIRSHNGCYKAKGNKARPVPSYYRNKIMTRFIPNLSNIRFMMSDSYGIKPIDKKRYSLREINDFRHELALKRNRDMVEDARQHLNPASVPYQPPDYTFANMKLLKDTDFVLYGDIVPF